MKRHNQYCYLCICNLCVEYTKYLLGEAEKRNWEKALAICTETYEKLDNKMEYNYHNGLPTDEQSVSEFLKSMQCNHDHTT